VGEKKLKKIDKDKDRVVDKDNDEEKNIKLIRCGIPKQNGTPTRDGPIDDNKTEWAQLKTEEKKLEQQEQQQQ